MSYPSNSPVQVQRLCEILEIERPVMCAPMAKIAGGRLAAAVSDAGGFGVLGGGYGDPTWIAEEMVAAGSSRIGIGLITWNMSTDAVENALSHNPAALWLSFGDVAPHVGPVHASGATLICQVGSVAEAIDAAAAGAEVIVAQGNESGGHGQSNRALFGLLPAVVAAVDPIPVVAAGGISTRAGYDAAVAFGAAGVALGTAFYASDESTDTPAAKQRLVDAGGDDTVRSLVYDIARGPEWPSEYSGRSLRSGLTDRWAGNEDELRANADHIKELHAKASAEGDVAVRVVWAGEGIDGINEVRPAGDIVRDFPLVLA
jgi:nitronate monooxygenase